MTALARKSPRTRSESRAARSRSRMQEQVDRMSYTQRLVGRAPRQFLERMALFLAVIGLYAV